jgi:hypothetical protein
MNDFVSAILEQPFAGRIKQQDPAAGIDQDYPVDCRFHDRSQASSAFAQSALDPFALSEIMNDRNEDRTVILLCFADREINGKGAAILAPAERLAAYAKDFSFASPPKIIDVTIYSSRYGSGISILTF